MMAPLRAVSTSRPEKTAGREAWVRPQTTTTPITPQQRVRNGETPCGGNHMYSRISIELSLFVPRVTVRLYPSLPSIRS